MPRSELSLLLTDAYRERLSDHQATVEAQARLAWGRIPRQEPDLDAEHDRWLRFTLPALLSAQSAAAVSSAGYTSAFVASELVRAPSTVPIDAPDYVGIARDGRPIRDALNSPLIGVKAALKQGQPLSRALDMGLTRALRMLWLAVDAAARESLRDAQLADDRIVGYRRAIAGTCGACLAAASRTFGKGVRFKIHPGCQCIAEPRVDGVDDTHPRATGTELFASMSRAEQDKAVGADVAALIRGGDLEITDLAATSPQHLGDDFITQAPLASLVADSDDATDAA
ncbi:MAG TPA: hypothetical protein VEW67_04070 [Thermoleophilaceae bacterium]|nr:hypothetical protein [Thermoleophilaceae bacterium]